MTIPFSPRNTLYDDITQTIGNTPLVRINKLTKETHCHATILAKLEFFNPLSSVKDRTALGMITAAEKEGQLKPGMTLVEPTSGNTGVGLAFISAVKGYHLILTMPEDMSKERRQLLTFLGATIDLTPAATGMRGAIERAEEIIKQTPNTLMLQQFENKANPAIHISSTAQEIWHDTKGEIDVFLAGVGTGGTLQGNAMALKKHNKNIKIIAIEPADSPVLSQGKAGPHAIQGIGANFVPPILETHLIDEIIPISTQDALNTAQQLAKKEGIFAGISSGAAMAGALQMATREDMKDKTIVTILPDSAERYLSTDLFT